MLTRLFLVLRCMWLAFCLSVSLGHSDIILSVRVALSIDSSICRNRLRMLALLHIKVMLLALFASPGVWLIWWGIRHGKLADWRESLSKLGENVARLYSRYRNKVVHEEELRRRSTIISSLKRNSRERRSTKKTTKVLI